MAQKFQSLTFWDNDERRTLTATVGRPAPGDGREVLLIEEGGWGYFIWLKGRGYPMNVNKVDVHQAPVPLVEPPDEEPAE